MVYELTIVFVRLTRLSPALSRNGGGPVRRPYQSFSTRSYRPSRLVQSSTDVTGDVFCGRPPCSASRPDAEKFLQCVTFTLHASSLASCIWVQREVEPKKLL